MQFSHVGNTKQYSIVSRAGTDVQILLSSRYIQTWHISFQLKWAGNLPGGQKVQPFTWACDNFCWCFRLISSIYRQTGKTNVQFYIHVCFVSFLFLNTCIYLYLNRADVKIKYDDNRSLSIVRKNKWVDEFSLFLLMIFTNYFITVWLIVFSNMSKKLWLLPISSNVYSLCLASDLSMQASSTYFGPAQCGGVSMKL